MPTQLCIYLSTLTWPQSCIESARKLARLMYGGLRKHIVSGCRGRIPTVLDLLLQIENGEGRYLE